MISGTIFRVIVLGKKIKYLFKFTAICLLVGIIFICSGYFYLNYELKETEKGESSVPYYSEAPENAGVLFDIYSDRTLFYMDFEKNTISILTDNKNTNTGDTLYGYPVDYTVSAGYDLLVYIIDTVGGIELETETEILRFTGVQIADMLSKSSDTKSLYRKVIPEIFKKIKEKGISREDLLYIIENSETNLTFPDCYYWSDYLKSFSVITIN